MDYLETDPMIDCDKVITAGHSRGGKTALWAAATDTRFCCAISNNSGCAGAAMHRTKNGGLPFFFLTVFAVVYAVGRRLPRRLKTS